jgi:hypothetical protein
VEFSTERRQEKKQAFFVLQKYYEQLAKKALH